MSNLMMEIGHFSERELMEMDSYLTTVCDNNIKYKFDVIPDPDGGGDGTLLLSVELATLIVADVLHETQSEARIRFLQGNDE